MNFLLDTNALLWSQQNPQKLSRKIRSYLEDSYSEVYYSPISIWEIAIKYAAGKLSLGGLTPSQFLDYLEEESALSCLELLSGTLATSYMLPLYHRDPFDRMIIWEALQHDLVLVSSDNSFSTYRQEGLRLIC